MPSAWVSFATIARVNEADSAEIASSSRGTKAASLTSSWSGSGRPDMYARRKTRNVSFAASVTRFRTARSEPVRPTMYVSPDGRRLADSANKGEQWYVFILDIRTNREKPLLRSDQSILQPEFSPDGQWLAVQSDFEADENFNIYVTPAAGGMARKITDTTWDSASPRWSPDGRRIAFTSNRDGDRDNVFVVEATGSETKQLTNVDELVTEIA